MKREIRIPKQKRSIEKKNKIIEAAIKLFNELGYADTNTALIAKEAGLSTGCVYDYFLDKDDILVEAIKMHHEKNNQIAKKKLKEFPLDMEIEELMEQFIRVFLEVHNHTFAFQLTAMSLSMTKPEIREILSSYRNPQNVDIVIQFFQMRGIVLEHPTEKILLMLNTMDQVCHDLLLDETKEIDAEIYIKECARMLAHLLQS